MNDSESEITAMNNFVITADDVQFIRTLLYNPFPTALGTGLLIIFVRKNEIILQSIKLFSSLNEFHEEK